MPALSEPGHAAFVLLIPQGGPTFLLMSTLNVWERVPLDEVEAMAFSVGGLHPTGSDPKTGEPSETVGSLGVMLHSTMYPSVFAGRPLPVTVTIDPFTRFVFGLMVKLPWANATAAAETTSPPATKAAAVSLQAHQTVRDE